MGVEHVHPGDCGIAVVHLPEEVDRPPRPLASEIFVRIVMGLPRHDTFTHLEYPPPLGLQLSLVGDDSQRSNLIFLGSREMHKLKLSS